MYERPPYRMLAFVCLAVFLCGCARGCTRATLGGGELPDLPSPVDPSAGDTIAAIGSYFVQAGCWALGIAVLARVATFVFAIARPFAGIIDDAIIIAGSSIAFGYALVWVGVNSWVLWVVCLACLGFWIAYRRKSIVRLWQKIVKGRQ